VVIERVVDGMRKGQAKPLTFSLAIICFVLLLMLVNFLPFTDTEKRIATIVVFIFLVSYILVSLYEYLGW